MAEFVRQGKAPSRSVSFGFRKVASDVYLKPTNRWLDRCLRYHLSLFNGNDTKVNAQAI
jgi:hypothetical protein